MDPIELARIGPEDWREFREVRLASLAEAPDAFGSRYDEWADADEERWRSRLTDVSLTIVARAGGRPVGVVSGAPSDGTDGGPAGLELISLWVSPGQRGSGLTRRLIDAVVDEAAGQGRRTFLMVRDDNLRAIRAYERAGFTDQGIPDGQPADVPAERLMLGPLAP